MSTIITPQLVALDADLGRTPREVVGALVERMAAAGRTDDPEGLLADAMAREAKTPTGMRGGLAIPHCRSEHAKQASLGFARLNPKADFGAPDGDVDLVFYIATPAQGEGEHLKLLTALARHLVHPEFVASLRAAKTPEEIVELVDEVVSPKPAAPAAPASEPAAKKAGDGAAPAAPADQKHLVAVTACPTGIAHTYMAADALSIAAKKAGVDLVVETQGSAGGTKLTAAQISQADAVIFAVDVGVRDKERFAGKPVITSGTNRAIDNPDDMIADAVAASANPNAKRVAGDASAAGGSDEDDGEGIGTKTRKALMTGVSYMIPFVAAGGLLIALSFLLGGYKIANVTAALGADPTATGDKLDPLFRFTLWNLPPDGFGDLNRPGWMIYLAIVLFVTGQAAFHFLVPALAGYISYGIADRPGIAPGFTAGLIAVVVGSGFLGGLVGGLLAGVIALYIGRIPLPSWAQGLRPVVITPLLSTLAVGLIMFMLLGKPLAWVMTALSDWLNGMSGGSTVVLGIILGLMMCFDLGGPVNKAAYLFATANLANGSIENPGPWIVMAAVMCGGMVPPLAMALSTVLRPKLYTSQERENGKAAWLLGASFISEGAIPFAAADPLRVVPSMMLGGAVTGGIIGAFKVTLQAPHGGIFVFFAVGHLQWFLIALVAGTVVAGLCVTLLKSISKKAPGAGEPAEAQAVAA